MGRRLNAATPLDYTTHPDAPKLVIATIVSNHQTHIDKLIRALESLRYLKGDRLGYPTPILVFNDRTLSNYQLERIVQSTDRPVAFPGVNELDVFPPGFNPNKENNTAFNAKSYWFYPKLTKFWMYTLWKHPAIDAFDFVMRIDFDTCFHENNAHLPDFAKLHKTYHAQYVGMEPDASRVHGLFDFVTDYMAKEDILPTNPVLWQLITNTWITQKTLPLYQVSLEVIRKSFMQHEDVKKFHEAVVNKEPYGIFEYGWSDHVLRFIDTAMFVSNENFMTTEFKGFSNRLSCDAGPPPPDKEDANKAQENENTTEELKEEAKKEDMLIEKDSTNTKGKYLNVDNDSKGTVAHGQQINKGKEDVVDTKEQEDNKEKENVSEQSNGEAPILNDHASENIKRQERG